MKLKFDQIGHKLAKMALKIAQKWPILAIFYEFWIIFSEFLPDFRSVSAKNGKLRKNSIKDHQI